MHQRQSVCNHRPRHARTLTVPGPARDTLTPSASGSKPVAVRPLPKPSFDLTFLCVHEHRHQAHFGSPPCTEASAPGMPASLLLSDSPQVGSQREVDGVPTHRTTVSPDEVIHPELTHPAMLLRQKLTSYKSLLAPQASSASRADDSTVGRACLAGRLLPLS